MRAENYEAQAKRIAQLEERLMQQEIDNETHKEANQILTEMFRDNKLKMGSDGKPVIIDQHEQAEFKTVVPVRKDH